MNYKDRKRGDGEEGWGCSIIKATLAIYWLYSQIYLTTPSWENEWVLPSIDTWGYDLQVVLPVDYQCEQSVLQWTLHVALQKPKEE